VRRLYLFLLLFLVFTPGSAAVRASWPLGFNAYDGSGNTCLLNAVAHYDPAYQPAGGYKPLFWLTGDGWRGVGHLQENSAIVQSLTSLGYIVWSTEYRGVRAGGAPTTCAMQTVPPDVQIDDVTRGFATAQVATAFFYNSVTNAERGWVLAGHSAGGNLAANLTRQSDLATQANIRSVLAVNSPLSFWDIWMMVNNNQNPSISRARALQLPGGGEGSYSFSLQISGYVANLVNSFFEGQDESPGACEVIYNSVQDLWRFSGFDLSECFARYHDKPGLAATFRDTFIANNTFFDLGQGGIPAYITSATQDIVVPTEVVLAVCDELGGPQFVSYDPAAAAPKAYVADCGSSNVRYSLIEGGGHYVWEGIWPDFAAWDDALQSP